MTNYNMYNINNICGWLVKWTKWCPIDKRNFRWFFSRTVWLHLCSGEDTVGNTELDKNRLQISHKYFLLKTDEEEDDDALEEKCL